MIEATPAVKIVPPDMVTHRLADGQVEIKWLAALTPGEEVSLDDKRWMVIMSMSDGRAWLRPKSAT